MPSPAAASRPGAPTGRRTDRWLGGVASGLAEHLGLPVLWVRMGLRGAGRVRWLRRGAVRRTVAVPAGPSGTPTRSPRAWTPPPGRASAAAAAKRRLADYGPLVAVGRDRHRRAARGHDGHRPDAGPRPAAARRWPAWRCCGGRPTRRSAQRWLDPSRRMGPITGHRRRRGLAGLPAHRCRPAAARRGDHAVLAALRQPDRGAQRRARRRVRHRRPRLHGGSVAVPALLRPQRGARGPGAVGGTRRCRRPPARLRAADPGPDPALGR